MNDAPGHQQGEAAPRPQEQATDVAAADGGTALEPSDVLSLMRRFLHGGGGGDQAEQAGCALWDLAASESLSALLLRHRILDVIEAVLTTHLAAAAAPPTPPPPASASTPPRPCTTSDLDPLASTASHRTIEICLGILANLCAHDAHAPQLHAARPLLALLLSGAPWLPDPACLGEMCRLLSVALRKEGYDPWLQLLDPHILRQLLLVAANTLEPTCLERCLDALVAVVHADQQRQQRQQQQQQQQGQQQQQQQGQRQHVQHQDEQGQQQQEAIVTAGGPDSATEPGPAAAPAGEAASPAVAGAGCGSLTSELLSGGLMDVLTQVLSSACVQLQQREEAEGDDGEEAGGAAGAGGAGMAAVVNEGALDAALRMVEELVAAPEGRVLLLPQQPQQPQRRREAMQQGGVEVRAQAEARHVPGSDAASEEPTAEAAEADVEAAAAAAARLLPGLLLRLLMLTESSQVVESLVILLVDLSPSLLPLLLANPRPLERLVDLVAEVTAATQGQVIEAAWYLTAATLQEAVQAAAAGGVTTPAAGQGEASPSPPLEAVQAVQVVQAVHVVQACRHVVQRLQQLPTCGSCGGYEQRCTALLQAVAVQNEGGGEER